MTRKPSNVSWYGVTQEQGQVRGAFDQNGNNGWSRSPFLAAVMPTLLERADSVGLSFEAVKEAMRSVGYPDSALHMLDRWESKRRTGRFGR